MIVIVAGNPRSHALRGVVAILFGLAALIWPGPTVLVFVLLFGLFALIEGASTLTAAFSRTSPLATPGPVRNVLLVHALISIFAGVVTLVWPTITALALLYVIAAWAMLSGALQIYDAWRLRSEINNEWMLVVLGVLRLAFGVILLIAPGAGALAITWLIGWFALLDGVLHLALAWRLHKLEPGRRDSVIGSARPAAT
jgi:uncharacterized membrane protein HdeD (DUF308 family)